jgi:hypothetical protein
MPTLFPQKRQFSRYCGNSDNAMPTLFTQNTQFSRYSESLRTGKLNFDSRQE